MTKNHLKPQKAPKTWTIKRKNTRFVTRPNAGAHRIELSMPINIVLRNLLGVANTNKEVKKILHDQEVLIDGKRRKDYKFSIGLMDVLSIPKINKHFVMLLNEQNKLFLQPIDKKDSNQKISKITGKKIVKKGATQLKTHDGRTFLVKKDEYQVGDSVLVSLPKQEIKSVLKLEKGATITLYRGKYTGTIATVSEVKNGILTFNKDSKEFETKKVYAIVIEKDKPIMKVK
ncbi:30S ribosomal protein S4e [Candidatus Woesearchaeota archaeon]|nr:30S ribosomal protein S4e [Candidatus Woesearchaeota archaeon]